MRNAKQIIIGVSIIIVSILIARILISLGETDTTISALGIIIGVCCIFTKQNLFENTGE